jgi:hypothetical protein
MSSSQELVVTVRLIKSFEYKTVKNVVLKTSSNVYLRDLLAQIKEMMASNRVYKMVQFDTFKLYFVKHGHKTQNLIINLEDDVFLDMDKTISENGIENETEISLFCAKDYFEYRANPTLKWE